MSSAPPAQQSKPSYHRRHPNSGPQQPQQRYVPKSAAPPAPKPSPPPTLTTALRSSAAPSASGAGSSSSSSGGGAADGCVSYLPHDEAVAAGLGGLDAQESQAVVDLLNDALAALLRAKPREFWRQAVAGDVVRYGEEDLRRRAEDVVERARRLCEANSVQGVVEVLEGEPRYVLCNAVEKHGADLLVVGSHGYGAIKRAFLGSVSDYCAHHAH